MTQGLEAAIREMAERILAQHPRSQEEINRIKMGVCREHHLATTEYEKR
jgi:histone acetyltransferase (RNA polymerase elongator complex component)